MSIVVVCPHCQAPLDTSRYGWLRAPCPACKRDVGEKVPNVPADPLPPVVVVPPWAVDGDDPDEDDEDKTDSWVEGE